MKVRQDFKDLIPPLSNEEYSQLEENCLREGIRDPLVVWGNILVDGHNRYKIATEHGLEYKTVSMDFKDENEAKTWIIKNQFGRRNMSVYDRVLLVLKLKPEIAEKAKVNRLATQNNKRASAFLKSDKQINTAAVLAKLAGVGKDTIHKVEVIEAKAPELIKQAVREGKLSINQAYNKVHPKPPDPVKEAKEDHERFQVMKNDKVVDFNEIKKDKTNKKIIMTAMQIDLFKIFDLISKFVLDYGDNLNDFDEFVDSDEQKKIAINCMKCEEIMKTIICKTVEHGGEE